VRERADLVRLGVATEQSRGAHARRRRRLPCVGVPIAAKFYSVDMHVCAVQCSDVICEMKPLSRRRALQYKQSMIEVSSRVSFDSLDASPGHSSAANSRGDDNDTAKEQVTSRKRPLGLANFGVNDKTSATTTDTTAAASTVTEYGCPGYEVLEKIGEGSMSRFFDVLQLTIINRNI
jgi:hypothetical protein